MAITDLPTRTSNSIGATKTDRRPPTGATYEWKAAEVNETLDRIVELYDEVGLSDGSTVGSLNERVATLEAVPTPTTTLIEWNGGNLNQFATAITSGFTNPTLTYYTSGSQKSLRFQADAASAGAYYIRYFSTPVAAQDMTGRCLSLIVTCAAGDEIFAGLAFAGVSAAASPQTLTISKGVKADTTTAGRLGVFNDSDPLAGAEWTSGSQGTTTVDLNWLQTAGSGPSVFIHSRMECVDGGSFYSTAADHPSYSGLAATWVDVSANRVGIMFYSGGATNPVDARIWGIKFEER